MRYKAATVTLLFLPVARKSPRSRAYDEQKFYPSQALTGWATINREYPVMQTPFPFFFLFIWIHQGKFLTIKSRNSNTCGYQKQTFLWTESWYKCSFTSISAPSLKLMVQIDAIFPFKCLCSRNSPPKKFLDR